MLQADLLTAKNLCHGHWMHALSGDNARVQGRSSTKVKALGMLGRSEEAHKVYIKAIQASRGDPGATGTWTKCYASLGKWTTAQLADMQAAATFLAGVHVHTIAVTASLVGNFVQSF